MLKKAIIVKAVVFDSQGQILLVRRTETAPRRPLEWDLPGGFVDNDDGSYVKEMHRELYEETGLEAIDGSIQLGYAESKLDRPSLYDTRDITWLFFTAKAKNSQVKLSFEHDRFVWTTIDKALELITYDRQIRALNHLKQAQEAAPKII